MKIWVWYEFQIIQSVIWENNQFLQNIRDKRLIFPPNRKFKHTRTGEQTDIQEQDIISVQVLKKTPRKIKDVRKLRELNDITWKAIWFLFGFRVQ